jgi:hypothetical protein
MLTQTLQIFMPTVLRTINSTNVVLIHHFSFLIQVMLDGRTNFFFGTGNENHELGTGFLCIGE